MPPGDGKNIHEMNTPTVGIPQQQDSDGVHRDVLELSADEVRRVANEREAQRREAAQREELEAKESFERKRAEFSMAVQGFREKFFQENKTMIFQDLGHVLWWFKKKAPEAGIAVLSSAEADQQGYEKLKKVYNIGNSVKIKNDPNEPVSDNREDNVLWMAKIGVKRDTDDFVFIIEDMS